MFLVSYNAGNNVLIIFNSLQRLIKPNKFHFLDISKETRWELIQQRNTEKGVTFQFNVSKSDFNFMETWFEIPTTSEMDNGIVIVTVTVK